MQKLQGIGDLSIDDFELVAALEKRRSVAAVARDRSTSGSQVSRALGRIEGRLGTRLFHRTTHGVSPTLEGQMVAEHAARICADAGALFESLLASRDAVQGRVRLSVSHILGMHVVAPALDALCQSHPGLHVDLLLDDRLVEFASDSVDVAVRAGVPPLETRWARHLGRHRRCLVASATYVAMHGQPGSIEDLHRFRLVSNGAVAQQNQWRFERHGELVIMPVKGQIRADNTAAVLALALGGAGIAWVNEAVAAPHIASGMLVPLLKELADRSWYDVHAVTLAGRFRTPRVRAVFDWLRVVFSLAGFQASPAVGPATA
jgi:DNA-binding transcriptional LysR family regulator